MDPEAAARVLDHALAIGPCCGSIVLIGIDGRSGAGKTTLAAGISALAEARGLTTRTVHNDELCPGWDGLPSVPERLAAIAAQLAEHGRATYPTWDWLGGHAGPDAEIPPSDVVIIEGVCANDPAWHEHRSATVWVEAPADLRKRRAIGRDGESFARHWDQWAAAEDQYYARTPPRPDVLIDVD